MFKKGKGTDEHNIGLPQYYRVRKHSDLGKSFTFQIDQSSNFKGSILLTFRVPADQGLAEDNKVLIDLSYFIFTTFSKGDLETMKKDDLRDAFSNALPTYLNNQVSFPKGGNDRVWGTRRSRFELGIFQRSLELAKAVVQCRPYPSHEETISNFLQCSVDDLIENNESTMAPLIDVMERSMQANPQAKPTPQEVREMRLKVDMSLGGRSRGLSLKDDLGLSPEEIERIDPIKDMILFSNRVCLPENGCLYWTKGLIPFFNEKTIALYVMMREIHKMYEKMNSSFGWNKDVDGEFIQKILDDGKLYCVEHKFDSQTGKLTGYRLAENSYTSADIIALCDEKSVNPYPCIYKYYTNNFHGANGSKKKKIWDIE